MEEHAEAKYGMVWGGLGGGASCTSKVKRANMVLSGSVDHAGHLTALRGRPWTKRWWNESDVGRLPKGRGGGGKKGDTHTPHGWAGLVSLGNAHHELPSLAVVDT